MSSRPFRFAVQKRGFDDPDEIAGFARDVESLGYEELYSYDHVGAVSQEECDELGMTEAQRLACRRAIDGLGVVPDVAVTDGKWNFVSPCVRKVEMRVKADRDCLSVAAASILASVASVMRSSTRPARPVWRRKHEPCAPS